MATLGIISDIHGNIDALTTVYTHMLDHHQIDTLIVAGDIVGSYGPSNECVSFIEKHADIAVLGNHDAYIEPSYPYTPVTDSQRDEHRFVTESLSADHVDTLIRLPERYSTTIDGMTVLVAHADPRSNNPTGHPSDEYLSRRSWPSLGADCDFDLTIIGHTHDQSSLSLDKFDGLSGIVVNPGTVGASIDPPTAEYAVVETTTGTVSLESVPYRWHNRGLFDDR